jgi:hypothetical protein
VVFFLRLCLFLLEFRAARAHGRFLKLNIRCIENYPLCPSCGHLEPERHISMDFKVFDFLDAALVSNESHEAKASRTPSVWPSEASAIRTDKRFWEIVGKCHRASFFRMTGQAQSRSVDPIGAWRWVTGRQIESHMTALAKVTKPQIFLAGGVKLFVSDIYLPLEMDLNVIDPATGQAWIIESKTIYGHYANKEIMELGSPKNENVLQICMYLLEVKTGKRLKELIKYSVEERRKLDQANLDRISRGERTLPHRNRVEADLELLEKVNDGPVGAKLTYISRDECERREFNISIMQDFDGFHYPVVDGMPNKVFTIESIYERYRTLQNYWFVARLEGVKRMEAKGILPPSTLELVLAPGDVGRSMTDGPQLTKEERAAEKQYLDALDKEVRNLPASFWPPAEYEYSYSPEKIEQMRAAGEISKSKYENYKLPKTSKSKAKLTRIGDFHCDYCPHQSLCLPQQQPQLAYQMFDISNLDENVEVEIG